MKTLLYVEDSPDDRFLVERACGMGQVSFLLKTVESGFEAIRYLSGEEEFGDRAENPIPDLILLDLQMREADGFEVLRWIRGDPTTRAIPVALYTGSFVSDTVTCPTSLPFGRKCAEIDSWTVPTCRPAPETKSCGKRPDVRTPALSE